MTLCAFQTEALSTLLAELGSLRVQCSARRTANFIAVCCQQIDTDGTLAELLDAYLQLDQADRRRLIRIAAALREEDAAPESK